MELVLPLRFQVKVQENPKRPTINQIWLRHGTRKSSDAGDAKGSAPVLVGKTDSGSIVVKSQPSASPDEPPAPMALVDEIPFAPIEKELHPSATAPVAAMAPKPTAGTFNPKDPWNIGVQPQKTLTSKSATLLGEAPSASQPVGQPSSVAGQGTASAPKNPRRGRQWHETGLCSSR